jgi:hypothetical protein
MQNIFLTLFPSQLLFSIPFTNFYILLLFQREGKAYLSHDGDERALFHTQVDILKRGRHRLKAK